MLAIKALCILFSHIQIAVSIIENEIKELVFDAMFEKESLLWLRRNKLLLM